MNTLPDASLLRLMQLTSPALPVGAFAYSQGLEYAAHAGWLTGEHDALDWVRGVLGGPFCHLDLPLLQRMHAAWSRGDGAEARRLSTLLLAFRETRELEQEDVQAGRSLARVLVGQGIEAASPWVRSTGATLAAMHALAATSWKVPERAAMLGYVFTWAEAQVGALSRLLPIGQLAAQRILSAVTETAPAAVDAATRLGDDEIGAFAPSFALASALHETQYTRLFRS
jgi:urease accessory protein